MHLHGRLGDSEIMRDLLVQSAGGGLDHDLALTRRQRAKTISQLSCSFLALAPSAIAGEARFYCVEELLVAEWLGKKFDGTSLHRLYGHGNIAVGREEDDWKLLVCLRELPLKVEPASPRHSDIHDEAGRPLLGRGLLKKFGDGRELPRVQSDGPQETADRVAKLWIVVDD